MNFRVFGNYLMGLAAFLFLIGLIALANGGIAMAWLIHYAFWGAGASLAIGTGLLIAAPSNKSPGNPDTQADVSANVGGDNFAPSANAQTQARALRSDARGSSVAEQLAELSRLKNSGDLSPEQFEVAKAKVLA